jgi:hypothetical protein
VGFCTGGLPDQRHAPAAGAGSRPSHPGGKSRVRFSAQRPRCSAWCATTGRPGQPRRGGRPLPWGEPSGACRRGMSTPRPSTAGGARGGRSRVRYRPRSAGSTVCLRKQAWAPRLAPGEPGARQPRPPPRGALAPRRGDANRSACTQHNQRGSYKV